MQAPEDDSQDRLSVQEEVEGRATVPSEAPDLPVPYLRRVADDSVVSNLTDTERPPSAVHCILG